MVAHMMPLEPFPYAGAHWEVVGGIMGQVIGQVTQDETGKKRADPMAPAQDSTKQQMEKSVKQQCQWDADYWRHHQSGFALRLRVVHTVKQEENFLLGLGFWVVVKNETVQQVFSQRPKKQTH